jgi:2-hydroxychromene-2-carboxylate isomerase
MLSFEAQQKNSLRREEKRQKENRLHTVYYFHQVNDPYSHLCAQILKPLTDNYEIDLIPLIVGKPPKSSTPEATMRMKHSIKDAAMIAPYFLF